MTVIIPQYTRKRKESLAGWPLPSGPAGPFSSFRSAGPVTETPSLTIPIFLAPYYIILAGSFTGLLLIHNYSVYLVYPLHTNTRDRKSVG